MNLTLEEKISQLEKKIDALLGEDDTDNKIVDKKTMDTMGRITIPKSFRKILGIENSSAEFVIILKDNDIILRLKNISNRVYPSIGFFGLTFTE